MTLAVTAALAAFSAFADLPPDLSPTYKFCDAFLQFRTNPLLGLLGTEYQEIADRMDPDVADVNGESWVQVEPETAFELNGNGLLDCTAELGLLYVILMDEGYDQNGLDNPAAVAAYNHNGTQFGEDVGSYWVLFGMLVPGLHQILKGFMTLGDGEADYSNPDIIYASGSAGFVQGAMFLLGENVTNPTIDLADYARLPEWLGLCGDADGDGVTNCREYLAASSDADYIARALDPGVSEAGADPQALCASCPGETSWTLEVAVQGGGSVTVDPDLPEYQEGLQVALTAVDNGAWVFDHWEGDLSGDINPQDLIMDSDKSVTAVFVELPPVLEITSPNGGEVWIPGAQQIITWDDLGSGCDEVKLKLFRGSAPYAWIAPRTANDGEHVRQVPCDLPPGDNYRVKVYCVSDFAMADFSDGPFSVAPTPGLRLTSPNGGEEWMPATPHSITWESAGEPGAQVKLKLFQDCRFLRWISGSTPDDGEFRWRVPCYVPPGCDYQIKIYAVDDFSVLDFSDAPFCIAGTPDLTLTAPNGGEEWIPGGTYAIAWDADPGIGPSVKLRLYRDCQFLQWISGATPNDGEYVWRTPCDLTPDDGYGIRAYAASDSSLSDYSDAPFSFVEGPLRLTSPNGGEAWPRGVARIITWDPGGVPGNVKLKLFRNCAFDRWISHSTSNTGLLPWAIPPDVEPGGGYRVRIYSASDPAILDLSNGDFTITE